MEIYKNTNLFKTKKFLLQNKVIKIYEKDVYNKEGVLATSKLEHQGLDIVEKIYFDTVDRFFFSKGLLIYLVKTKSSRLNTIVVRYEGEDKRVPFISYMPKTLCQEVEKKDYFSAHFDFIVDAINKIMPAGLNVNVSAYVNTIIPVFVVLKKCNKCRVIFNDGLKMLFSFEAVEYINNANKNKYKLNQFEIKLEDVDYETKFEDFIKKLILQVPTIIPIKDSDILNGLDYTSITAVKTIKK